MEPTFSVRRTNRLRFGMVDPEVIYRDDLSPQSKALYAMLACYADVHGESWPKRVTLAQQMGVAPRTITRLLGELEEAGILRITLRREAMQASLYHLDDFAGARDISVTSPSGHEGYPPSDTSVPTLGTSVSGPSDTSVPSENRTTEQDHLNRTNEQNPDADASGALPGMPESPAKATKPRSVEDDLTKDWWERLQPKPAGKNAYLAARGVVRSMLAAGWSVDKVRGALLQVDPPLSTGRMEYVLRGGPRNGHTPVSDFSNGQGWYAEDRRPS